MAIDIVIQGDYKDRDIKRAHRDLDLLGKQSGTTGAAFSKMSGDRVSGWVRPSVLRRSVRPLRARGWLSRSASTA
jgi:hypothetical protein